MTRGYNVIPEAGTQRQFKLTLLNVVRTHECFMCGYPVVSHSRIEYTRHSKPMLLYCGYCKSVIEAQEWNTGTVKRGTTDAAIRHLREVIAWLRE